MSSVSRRGLVSGAAAFGASLAVGCGAAGERDAASAGQTAKQPVTLRLNYRTEQWIVDRAQAFSVAYPWITLDLVANSGYEKLLVLAAAGDLGDVYWASSGQGSYFELAGQGHAMALDPIVKRDKFDLKQFFPHAIKQARLDGTLFALPEGIHPGGVGLFYNISMFEQAALKPPTLDWTVDDLISAAQRLTTPGHWSQGHFIIATRDELLGGRPQT